MHKITEETLTAAVLETIAGTDDLRLKEIMVSLVRHLHDFIKDVRLTPEEWRAGIDYLYATGKISTPERHEFILTSDVLGVSSLVDTLKSHDTPAGTEHSVLGPFYIEGSPVLPVGTNLIKDNDGDPIVVLGKVVTPDGDPIEGALLDLWHNAANGLYEAEDPDQPEANLRCKMVTGADGRYQFTSTRPVPYKVPDDGPVGRLLRATNRHTWRAAHLHFKVSADGYQPLVTEVFSDDDPYLNSDAVFGVRESLTVPFIRIDTKEEADKHGVAAPVHLVVFDFCLQPAL